MLVDMTPIKIKTCKSMTYRLHSTRTGKVTYCLKQPLILFKHTLWNFIRSIIGQYMLLHASDYVTCKN